MNYRHAFHAGNHADVLKHLALLFCLDALKRKDTPFGVLDTHAGSGRYDLFSAEAMRSPEWQQGIGEFWNWPEAPPAVTRLNQAVAAANDDGALRFYPGSPLLIAAELRAGDTLDACELHPEEYASLRQSVGRRGSEIRLHQRDGFEALTALLPPKQRRGLVLIDPPYEEANEVAKVVEALTPALHRFGHGVFLWWRPLKNDSELRRADAELRARGAEKMLRADLWVDTPAPIGKLNASSILVINPPFGLEDALKSALPAIARKLSRGAAGARVTKP
ncbi:MAG: 23S rRNA (adenine(2030)-N(6))-methyltransferase RlmJ [Terricaulis sp.]